MLESHAPRFVSAAEITRNFGLWQERAAQGPLIVTHHGRPRVVMLAVEEYDAIARDPAAEMEAARLSTVLNQIGTIFCAFDDQGRFVRVNPAAVAQFGVPERALLGRTAEEALGPPGRPLHTLLSDAMLTGDERQADLPGPRGERTLRMRIFPYPGGVALIARNVSGPLAAERAMAEAAAEARAREGHGGCWSVRLDARGKIETVEDGLATLVGFAPQRLVGVRVIDIFSIATRARVADAIDAVLAAKGARGCQADLLVSGREVPASIGLAERRTAGSVTGAAMLITAERRHASSPVPSA